MRSGGSRAWLICLSAFAAAMLFASCGKTPAEIVPFPSVDPAETMAFAEAQVRIGPRPAGSDNARKTAEWILSQIPLTDRKVLPFEAMTPSGKMTFRNVEAVLPGESEDFIIIGAHYDTKILSFSPDFTGANDGASGVAALLAMMKTIPAGTKLPFAVRFVFFDGEEAQVSYSALDGLYGSKAYAAGLAAQNLVPHCKAMILLDMIGDKKLHVRIPSDTNPELASVMLAAAKEKGLSANFSDGGPVMLDDHVPFQKLGIPAMDLIDFEYGPGNAFWHTSQDSLDKISGESMAHTADLVLEVVRKLVQAPR